MLSQPARRYLPTTNSGEYPVNYVKTELTAHTVTAQPLRFLLTLLSRPTYSLTTATSQHLLQPQNPPSTQLVLSEQRH